MKRYYKNILAVLLALVLTLSYLPGNVYAESSDSVEETVHAEVYFVQYDTKKLITLDGTVNNPISCTTSYTGEADVPDTGLFTVYYGKGNTTASQDKTVVNFTCKGTNTSWKADGSKVFQIAKRTNPSGWESVLIEPQGDGTVSFRSCANGNYFTVSGEELSLVKLSDGEKPSTNEKFIMYTTTKPKTATNLEISDIAGDSVTVSWQGVDECLYSGYEVLYATEENGNYKSAGKTADTSFHVTGLNLNTKYYFKIRTFINNESDVYSESETASAVTLKDYKPSKVSDISVANENGALVLNWKEASSTTGYIVYRAESRFAEYKEIAKVTETSYIDENPNPSVYKNYYKVKGYNDSDIGDLSEPASLEISMFGEDAYIFAPTDDATQIKEATEKIFEQQHYSQFGQGRYTLAFKPGDYTAAGIVNIGYYTQILGLGKTPYDVKLNNVKVPAALSGNNATCNFWVSIENTTIADTDQYDDTYFAFQWAASQASPARRLNVERTAVFDWYNGWASGGFVADSHFDKGAGSWSQQQYYYRNCHVGGGNYGVNWNQVIQGCEGNTVDTSDMVELTNKNGKTNCHQRKSTTVIDSTPVIREKPFLYFDTNTDSYKVFIPALRKNAKGLSWSNNSMGEGTSISVEKYFYIANPDKDTAATINAQLKAGKNIIFRPGIYRVSEPIQVTKANTVLLGLGMASIIPENNDTAIAVSDVGGVSIAGLILDAGNFSNNLLRLGEEGCNKDHSENPTVIQDVFFRVGGTSGLGRCESSLVVNSNDVIIDHTWIWRADHGEHTGWEENTAKNGAVVNGDNVTAYGLFCEHFQEYDIIWRGENGSTYFLQNEKCYDPQSQESWMSHDGTVKGYAAYKVANNVKKHYAVGLGVYDVFINTNGASIYLDNAIEVPDAEGVLIENACIVEIANGAGPQVGINHIVNSTTAGIRTGAGNNGGYAIQRLLSYNNKVSLSLPDAYTDGDSTEVQEEAGTPPTIDSKAEKDIKKDEQTKDNEIPLWDMTEKDYDDRIDNAENNEDNNNGGNNNGGDNHGGTIPKDDDNISAPKDNQKDTVSTLKVGQTFQAGKFTYKITKVTGKKGQVTLVKVRKKYRKNLKKATVKATVHYKGYGFTVTVVGKKAFAKCKKLTKVTIGKNVKTIKAKAFYSSKNLKTFAVKGKKLRKISKNTFYKKVRKSLKIKAKKKIKKIVLKSLKRKK